METLAEVITAARARTSLSQEQVGELIDRTGSAVGKWERGESVPSVLDLGLLASVLPIDRSAGELRDLRREALRQRQKPLPAESQGSGVDTELARLRVAVQSLSEHLSYLDEAVDFLESQSGA